MKQKIKAVWVIISIVLIGLWIWKGDVIAGGKLGREFVPGLDLAGGSALTYTIQTNSLPEGTDIEESVTALRDVIERRVNLFGVREPTVTTAYSRIAREWRLIIELPGVTDVKQAAKLIGETPVLEFRTLRPGLAGVSTSTLISDFQPTQLTGTYLKKSNLVFDQTTNRPMVELAFDDTGAKLFAAITKANIGREVSIFLDGLPISSPTVNEEITGGKAVISGSFSVEEARILVGRLNSGALPVPIALSGTTVVGPSLGSKAITDGVKSSVIGFALVALFMMLWYRLPGFLAVIALGAYTVIMLALFKLIPVTLTSAGIAGFIISLGLAVDANVLTFERMKEELRSGKSLSDAMEAGFVRAWTSIRDSHLAAIIVSIILFWFGTSIVKGFAFTFFLGAVVSLFSAQVITRTLLRAVVVKNMGKVSRFLFGSGFFKN
jgi:protein-export membrane protein SecD